MVTERAWSDKTKLQFSTQSVRALNALRYCVKTTAHVETDNQVPSRTAKYFIIQKKTAAKIAFLNM